MSDMAILFDTFLCSACKGCQVGCKTWNSLASYTGLNENRFSGSYQNPPDLRGDVRLVMTFNELEGGPKGVRWAFGRRSCQHCTNAGCVKMCPSGALFHDQRNGMVTYDDGKCIGCQRCAAGCPFGVPRYDPLTGTINKCTGCVDRIEHGMTPACVFECQTGALKFGERNEMLQIARARVKDLKERGFADACLYGEEQMDGLHVIHVLKYGVKAHEQNPHPELPAMVDATNVMKPITGALGALTGAGLLGMFLLGVGYHRNQLMYNAETGDTIDVDTGEVVKHGDGQDTESVKEHIFENLPIGNEHRKDGGSADADESTGREGGHDAE